MFDIGWSELLVIAIVAIVVVGPKDLPRLMRTIGFYAGKVRRTAADFQRQFHEAMAESEAEEVRKNIEAIRADMGAPTAWHAGLDKPVMTGEPPLATHRAGEPTRPKPSPAKKTAKKAVRKTAKTTAKKTAKAKQVASGKAKAKPKANTKAKR